MRRACISNLSLAAAIVVALAGCGGKETAGTHAGHEHGEEKGHGADAPAVKFKEGKGLEIPKETSLALGIKTAEVEERTIAHRYEVTASVFDGGPPARASSLLPVEVADVLEKHPPTEATLLSIRRDVAPALAQVEVVLALPGQPAVGSTVTLTLRGPAHSATTVPNSAILRSATGAFVYVVNGAHLMRTPVKIGAIDGEFTGLVDGLYSGDVVVTAAVEQLWLTELRLTKGGGHSH